MTKRSRGSARQRLRRGVARDQPRRRLERLAGEHGDNCMGCGRRFANHDTCVTGYDGAGALVILGQCCAEQRLVSVVGMSIYLDPTSAAGAMVAKGAPLSTGTAWGEDDRTWFAAHPERSHRLRAALPGEWPEGGWDLTVVRQLQPGERVRQPLKREILPDAPRDLAEEAAWLEETPEAAAWAFFELCREAGGTDRVLTKQTVMARAAALGTKGQA
jgi:hypothetical protein